MSMGLWVMFYELKIYIKSKSIAVFYELTHFHPIHPSVLACSNRTSHVEATIVPFPSMGNPSQVT